MKVFYSDTYTIPLPDGHKFPMSKYRKIRDALLKRKILDPSELAESPIFDPNELTLAQDERLEDQEVRRRGRPRKA